ncbi:MAG TPA: aquaporin [Candidatus Saccharimonadales bacterium]|nr:aquaporin [Candidatus Saccharimonadales bacterium]
MFKVNRAVVAPVLAEFLGAGILVMAALILGQTTAVSYFIATSLAITSAIVFMLFGMVSGAHANPAITFGLWTARRIGTLRSITYIAAQLLGGLAAWQLFQYLTNHTLPPKTITFSTPVWLAELVGAAVLALAYAAALRRRAETLSSAVTVGAAYFVGILIAATASAGYINPAIALGNRAWSSAYVLGPLVGGLIGVNLYTYFFDTVPAAASRAAVTVTRRTAAKRPAARRK